MEPYLRGAKMPRGRFLNKEICIDKKVNELSSYESMLGFTWLIPHLDCNGLTYGDPAVVRSMIFPRRNDITVEQMESYIKEWQKKGLIKVYEKGDEKYIWFPNFEKHQIGLKKEREAKSGIPLPDNFLIDAGSNPDEFGNNVKLSKGNVNSNVNENCNSNSEVEAESYSDQQFYLFSKVFQKETGLPDMSGGVPRYIKSINEMIDMGAIPDDLKVAIQELRKKEYQIVSPGSCVNAVRNVMGKRKSRSGSDNEKVLEEWLNGNKRVSNETDPEVMQTSSAGQTITRTA
jgi:hypothetical protein